MRCPGICELLWSHAKKLAREDVKELERVIAVLSDALVPEAMASRRRALEGVRLRGCIRGCCCCCKIA